MYIWNSNLEVHCLPISSKNSVFWDINTILEAIKFRAIVLYGNSRNSSTKKKRFIHSLFRSENLTKLTSLARSALVKLGKESSW